MIKQDLRVPPYANNTHQRLLHALLIDSLYIIPCNLLFFLNQTYFTHTDYHFYFNIDGVFSAPHKPAEHPHILYPQQMLQTPSRTSRPGKFLCDIVQNEGVVIKMNL